MNKDKFRANRKALGLNQSELAHELCCKGGYRVISRIERGTSNPSSILLRAFELFIENEDLKQGIKILNLIK